MPISAQEPVINYDDVIVFLSKEIEYVWKELASSSDESVSSLISKIKAIEVSDEQYYRKKEASRELRRGTVYLIVRFSAGAINYASSVTPVSIYGLGVANQVKPVQLLLGTFASYWTTKNLLQGLKGEASDMLQVWNTPEIISNFNVVDEDFRSLYKTTGNIVIGPAAVRVGTLTYYYGTNDSRSETINIMSFKDGYHTSLDSQPFGDTNGFVQSEANFTTYVFSISTYLLNCQLARDLLAMRGFRYRPYNATYDKNVYTIDDGSLTVPPKSSIADPNKTMKIRINFTNGFNNEPAYQLTNNPNFPIIREETSNTDPVKGEDFYMYFKVVDSGINQEIAGIPALTISFAR